MEIAKDKERIVIAVRCTRDEISDAIAVLEALRKDMPVDNQPRFPKAKPVECFLARLQRGTFSKDLNVEF